MDTYIIVLDCKLDSTGAGEGLMRDFWTCWWTLQFPKNCYYPDPL